MTEPSREQFEAWCRTVYGPMASLKSESGESYRDQTVNFMWLAWQAAVGATKMTDEQITQIWISEATSQSDKPYIGFARAVLDRAALIRERSK